MSIRNLNFETDLLAVAAQSTFLSSKNSVLSTSENISSDYAKILAEKISEVENEFEETKNNLSNQNFGGENSKSTSTETVKRFMPDGTIILTTYNGSNIVQQIKFPPHLVPVTDYSAPPNSSGEPAIKLEPKQNLDLFNLLM